MIFILSITGTGERRLLAGAFGAISRRRPHAKDAKAQRAPREEGRRIVVHQIIIENKMNLEIITIIPPITTPFLPFAFFAPLRD